MSVAKRKTKSGYTKEYHYAFAQDGKRYRGVCEGCTTKREAEEFEKNLRKYVQEAATKKDVKQLIEHAFSGGTHRQQRHTSYGSI